MAPQAQSKRKSKNAETLGSRIVQAIQKSIDTTTKAATALPIPGEGEERPFRNWLGSYLLAPVLGWPEDKIRIGETFDIILLDDDDKEVVTIETKAPLHKVSKKERADFEERLPRLPRLKAAYLTNGVDWERLDLVAQQGVQEIHRRESWDISKTSTDETESFFLPLIGNRYFSWGERNRSLVTRAQPHILEQLANDLDGLVADLASTLRTVFQRFETGDAGSTIQNLTRNIFDDWCVRSLQNPIGKLGGVVSAALEDPTATRGSVSSVLRGEGLRPQVAEEAADHLLAIAPPLRQDSETLRSAILPLYDEAIAKLCAQSAHLLLGRCLVYRVGEDMEIFESLLGGEAMESAITPRASKKIGGEPTPALALVEAVRRRMSDTLPLVYKLSDLDWWRVPDEEKEGLKGTESGTVHESEAEIELSLIGLLRTLDGYQFSSVDADVWRNVYQHYLPDEERQRLGGFFTHEEIVELILDLAGYASEEAELCQASLLDPACGSGAFVNVAAARLLKHLSEPQPCHADIDSNKKGSPSWLRDRKLLDVIVSRIHAVDIHPFAAFLTTLNLTFLLLPKFVSVQNQDPTYGLDLQVFSADSLEKPDTEVMQPEFFEKLNSRIQLTADSYDRYRGLLTKRFEFVVGNPPWGGVLKGPLSPVYEEERKRRFKREYPSAAHGKYDVYGLFLERAFHLLVADGTLAMVTQDTYLDKEWATKLRTLLSRETEVQYIVSLSPFGLLLFNALNTPAITVLRKRTPSGGNYVSVTIGSHKLKGDPDERRSFVLATVRRSIETLMGRRRKATVKLSTAARKSRKSLRDTAESGWDIRPGSRVLKMKKRWLSATQVLEPRQGVTPGGCLDIFLLSGEEARALSLEKALVHRAIKTRETEPWRPQWEGRVLFYPYVASDSGFAPAFSVKHPELSDALDFETALDKRERELRRGRVLDEECAGEVLEHRISLGLVEFPQAARYLTTHYGRLDGRVFKKQPIQEFGRRWYEYLWPRDPGLLLKKNRIISPSLTMTLPRFPGLLAS